MKYILVVGLEYKKYKVPAKITISASDRLIDTFELDDDKSSTDNILNYMEPTWFDKLDKTKWLHADEHQQRWKDHPKFYKTYLLEERHLNGSLTIDVQNSNNDFTNGFMNKNSLIKFPIIGIVPLSLLDNKAEKLMKIIVKFNHAVDHMVPRTDKDKQRTSWPTVNYVHIKNRNELYQKDGVIVTDNWIGGSFTLSMPIRQKHRIKYLGATHDNDKNDLGFWLTGRTQSLIIAGCKQLLNMYNEDQRSNNTKD